MKSVLEKAKSIIQKACNNMAKYYNYHCTPAPVFEFGNKIFLNSLNIHIMHPSTKLLHC